MILQFLIFFFLLINSILFMIMNHPLSMGLILMIQTLLMSLFTGIFSLMFWFSYSLFLIFMGGMLILFMYMTSLASNEIFNFSLKFKFFNLKFLLIIFLTLILFFLDFKFFMMNNKIINNDSQSFFILKIFSNQNYFLMLNKMYNFPTNLISILLVNYLFLTLIATVKITNIFQGPLRPKNN